MPAIPSSDRAAASGRSRPFREPSLLRDEAVGPLVPETVAGVLQRDEAAGLLAPEPPAGAPQRDEVVGPLVPERPAGAPQRDASAGPSWSRPGGLPRFRLAGADDAEQIALLHADSWRRHYRGAFADAFLDGDVAADRRLVWSARLAAPGGHRTVVAEEDGRMAGFVHVVFDEDARWGSLVDNLHVVHDRRRAGIGTGLLAHAARAVVQCAAAGGMYLWVLEQNTAAQRFYRARGAGQFETAAVSPPGGESSRLNGAPRKFRMAWMAWMAWSDAGPCDR